jgi:DNA-directed RNA polymerase specialized sigma24 family protein
MITLSITREWFADHLFMSAQSLTPSAFNALILADQDLLYTLASALLGDERRAETAAQQACQAAYQRLSQSAQFAQRETLFACLVEACSPGLPSRKDIPGGTAGRYGPVWRGLGMRRTPPTQLTQLAACLKQLPFRSCAAVALVDLAGFSYAETARILGCSPLEARSCLAIGRRCLSGLIPRLSSSHPPAG